MPRPQTEEEQLIWTLGGPLYVAAFIGIDADEVTTWYDGIPRRHFLDLTALSKVRKLKITIESLEEMKSLRELSEGNKGDNE